MHLNVNLQLVLMNWLQLSIESLVFVLTVCIVYRYLYFQKSAYSICSEASLLSLFFYISKYIEGLNNFHLPFPPKYKILLDFYPFLLTAKQRLEQFLRRHSYSIGTASKFYVHIFKTKAMIHIHTSNEMINQSKLLFKLFDGFSDI